MSTETDAAAKALVTASHDLTTLPYGDLDHMDICRAMDTINELLRYFGKDLRATVELKP